MNTEALAFALLLLPAVTACEMATGPDGQRVVGILEWQSAAQGSLASSSLMMADGNIAVITAPDTVDAGVPFEATITTVGSDGCWREAGAEKEMADHLAVVVPYDRVLTEKNGESIGCTQALVWLPRFVEITFAESGEAILRVKGRKVIGGNYAEATPVTVEKRIFVR
jgi:hypothetical protein